MGKKKPTFVTGMVNEPWVNAVKQRLSRDSMRDTKQGLRSYAQKRPHESQRHLFTLTKEKHRWIQIRGKCIIRREIIKFAKLIFSFSNNERKTHLNFLHLVWQFCAWEPRHRTAGPEFPTVIVLNLTHALPVPRHFPGSRNLLYLLFYPFLTPPSLPSSFIHMDTTDVCIRCFLVVWEVLWLQGVQQRPRCQWQSLSHDSQKCLQILPNPPLGKERLPQFPRANTDDGDYEASRDERRDGSRGANTDAQSD